MTSAGESAPGRLITVRDTPPSTAGWQPGDQILVDLPDEQVVRCRIVNVTEDGVIQVVPEHDVVIGHDVPAEVT